MRPILVNSRPQIGGRIAVDAKIAHAAGWDAADRSMRAAGRTAWNEDDWNAACETFDRLMALAGEPAPFRLRSQAARRSARRKAA